MKADQVKKDSKKIKKAPVQSTRTTRGVKLGNLSENAMVKKSYDQLQSKEAEKPKGQSKGQLGAVAEEGDDADFEKAFEIKKDEKNNNKTQKEIDKELRRYFERGHPHIEDEKAPNFERNKKSGKKSATKGKKGRKSAKIANNIRKKDELDVDDQEEEQ